MPESVSANLFINNAAIADSIRAGKFGSGRLADRSLVHMEQDLVQSSLNSLRQEDPGGYDRVVKSINKLLNGSVNFDNNYAGILGGVRKQLGRAIDFSKQSDREAIGNAVISETRDSPEVICTGSHIARKLCP